MKDEGHVSEFKSPMTGIVLTLIGFLFVDDTDLVVLGKKYEDEMSVHTRLQNSISCWNGILRVSGGALNPEKCYWYSARYKWKGGKCTLTEDNPPPIYILDNQDVPRKIEYKHSSEAT